MNLLETIAKGHSKEQCDKIVRYVGNDPARFAKLIKLFLSGPYRVTQRVAWPLSYCVEEYPGLIYPHLKKIIQNLKKPGINDAVKRNTARLLQFIAIPKSLQGHVTANCFALFQNPKEPVAIRVFTMTVLARIAEDQPELKNELRILIEDQLPYASPGFLARARKILKQLE